MKMLSLHFVGKGQSAFVFASTNRFQFTQQVAICPVIEHVHCNCCELLPVVPLAYCVLDLSKRVNEIAIVAVIRRLKDVTELLDLKPICVQIVSGSEWRG